MRLIDADEIHFVFSRGNNSTILQEVLLAILAESPTVDAVPVRHGKWVQRYIKIGGQVFKHGMQCSVCAEPALDNEGDDYLTNYCPNCGAKMDGEREKNEDIHR